MWRRVWSSMHLSADAGTANASSGVPSPSQNSPCERAAYPHCVADRCPLQCVAQASKQPFAPQAPNRCICPRCTGSRCFGDREPALRRHAPWSVEDAQSQPSAYRRRPGPYWCNCTGGTRRPAPWDEVPHTTDMCPTCHRPARYDRPNGAWDDVGEPPWEITSFAEYERRRAELQLWNPETTYGVPHPYDAQTHNTRWNHASRTLARCQIVGRSEAENRRRPSGDVGYCASEWDPVHVRRNTREYDLWDGLERGIRSSDGRDAQSSLENTGEYLPGRTLLQRYGVERENEAHPDTARRMRYGSCAMLTRMAMTQNVLSAALGSSETFGRECMESDILPVVSPLETRNCLQEPSQENHLLLAPPSNFSAGSNEDLTHSSDSNESELRQVANSDIVVRRPNSADIPENQVSLPKYANIQVECRARVSHSQETAENGTRDEQNSSETSRGRADDTLLDNILRSSKTENGRESASHVVIKGAISRAVNTSALEVISENELVGKEQVQERNDMEYTDDQIVIKECLPLRSFESAWDVIEQSNILQNSIENPNRNTNTEIQESTSCRIGTMRFIAPSQVPDIVDAAWKVIKLSDMYKRDTEKRKRLQIETEKIHHSQSREGHDGTPGEYEPARNVAKNSKVLNRDTKKQFDQGGLREGGNTTRRFKSSTEKHKRESPTTQRQLSKSARSHADSSRLEPKLLSAAWNVVKTSSAFRDELERLRRLSDVSAKEGSVTTETSPPIPSKPHVPRERRATESPDLFQQDKDKQITEQESKDAQVQSLYGERTMLSVKDGPRTFQMTDEGGKLDECTDLLRRYETITDGSGGHSTQLGGRRKSCDRSNMTNYRASTSMHEEVSNETHTKREKMSVGSCGMVKCNRETRKNEFLRESEADSFGNDLRVSNAPVSSCAISSRSDIWSMPGCSQRSEDMGRSQEEKKKMHFRISRKQSISTARNINNGTSSDFTECSDKDVAERKGIHILGGEPQPKTRLASPCRSSIQEDITNRSEESDIFSGDMRAVVLPSPSFTNSFGRRGISPIASELSRNQTYTENNATNLGLRTRSVDFKNDLPTIEESARTENKKIVVATDWQNTGAQTDMQNVRRIDSDHLNKCIQADESVTSFCLERMLIAGSFGDAVDRDPTSSGRSSASVQTDTVKAVKIRTENEEIIRRSRCIQVTTTAPLR